MGCPLQFIETLILGGFRFLKKNQLKDKLLCIVYVGVQVGLLPPKLVSF